MYEHYLLGCECFVPKEVPFKMGSKRMCFVTIESILM